MRAMNLSCNFPHSPEGETQHNTTKCNLFFFLSMCCTKYRHMPLRLFKYDLTGGFEKELVLVIAMNEEKSFLFRLDPIWFYFLSPFEKHINVTSPSHIALSLLENSRGKKVQLFRVLPPPHLQTWWEFWSVCRATLKVFFFFFFLLKEGMNIVQV